jgi:two-component system, OmpR family, response regulator MprA
MAAPVGMRGMSERILVVEDDEQIAAIVRDGLTRLGYRVELAADGPAALAAVRAQPCDLVVLDLLLPGMDGVEVCRRLRAGGGPPVIMLTARDAVAEKIAGLDSGADDYLTKPFVLAELVARVRAVLRRHAPRSPTPLRVADLRLDARGRRAWRGDRVLELSAREFDLLECLMQHAGQVLPHSTLLEQVWGSDFEGESNAVKVYVAYLRQKLNAAGEPDLLHTMRGVGYVLRE